MIYLAETSNQTRLYVCFGGVMKFSLFYWRYSLYTTPPSAPPSLRAALPESTRADLAASFQHTAVRHLEDKVRRAMDVVCQRPKQVIIVLNR